MMTLLDMAHPIQRMQLARDLAPYVNDLTQHNVQRIARAVATYRAVDLIHFTQFAERLSNVEVANEKAMKERRTSLFSRFRL